MFGFDVLESPMSIPVLPVALAVSADVMLMTNLHTPSISFSSVSLWQVA